MMNASSRATAGAGRQALPLAAPLAALRAQLGPRWQALAPRERRGLLIAATALLALLLWLVAIQPAWKVLRSAPAQRAELQGQLALMRSLAAEARELRAQPPVTPEQAQAALESATSARLGSAAKLAVNGERVTATFTGVDPVAFTEWLREVRSAARARVVEAQLNRSAQAYSGSVVLTLPRPL